MTAMSLIVQPHAAYLLTDTAHYLADGTAVSFAPKVAELHFGGIEVGRSARAAYALTGVVNVAGLNTVIDKAGLRYDDVRGFLAGLPDLIRGVSLALPNVQREAGVGDSSCIGMAVAWWDDATGAPYGFLIGNEQFQPVAQGHMQPFTLTRMRNYVMQQGAFAFEGVDYSDPLQFDPMRDGGRLLDSQRLDPFGDDGNQFCGVGGQGVLTEVNASGVRQRLVRTWPDKAGERIAA